MSRLKIIRTEHHSDNKLKPIVRNYFVISDGYIPDGELSEELKTFADKHKPKPSGNINVLFFNNSSSALIADYMSLTGEKFVEYADNHPAAYCMGYMLKNPMKGDAYNHIKANFDKFKDVKFKTIVWDLHKSNIVRDNDDNTLRKVIAFENDKSQTEVR